MYISFSFYIQSIFAPTCSLSIVKDTDLILFPLQPLTVDDAFLIVVTS